MVSDSINLEAIVTPMREPIRRYMAIVREAGGEHAKALTFFGAVVAGVFDPARYTARNVLVLDRVDLSLLRRLASHGPGLGKARIAAPLVMTPEYIQASRDTFALELIEIQQKHVTVFGEDHFQNLTFEDSHVRLQCERELKVSLITLSHGLLASAGREKDLVQVQFDVAEGLVRTVRGLLWLKGRREAKPAVEVLAAVEAITERKLNGLRSALAFEVRHGVVEFDELYHDVQALKKIVDGW